MQTLETQVMLFLLKVERGLNADDFVDSWLSADIVRELTTFGFEIREL